MYIISRVFINILILNHYAPIFSTSINKNSTESCYKYYSKINLIERVDTPTNKITPDDDVNY